MAQKCRFLTPEQIAAATDPSVDDTKGKNTVLCVGFV
jgi:hypothetical protein